MDYCHPAFLLNLNLPAGTTYLWLTYNIASNATVGHVADAKIVRDAVK